MSRSASKPGMTLVELLVVVAIVALLLSVLVPVVAHARQAAMRAVCMSNLYHVGRAVHTYAADYRGSIPFGPTAPPVVITNFYLYTGHVTNLISLESGEPVGLGLLLDRYLDHQPQVIFCPANDQPVMTEQQIAAVGQRQVQSSYFYRHGSVVEFAYPPDTRHIDLHDLGENRAGHPIRALAMDANLLAPPSFAPFGIFTRTTHERRWVNALYADNHVQTLDNADDAYTVDLATGAHQAPARILGALERADLQ